VGHVAEMLRDVPAVSEGIVELTVQVAAERLVQGLTNLGSGHERLREDRLGVLEVEREDDGGAADREWRQHTELRELIRQMQPAVADPQLNRHEPPVGRGDAGQLLCLEGLAVEGRGALGA
jgi:hypothetical protein